jgi:hypothetical protein
MHILQHPVRGPVHRHPEIGQETVVPGRLQVAQGQIPPHQRAFEIEAQHDVQVVMHLVGFCPDVAGRNPVHGAGEVLGPIDRQRAKEVDHPPVKPVTKGGRAGQLVLVDPALAFVDAH